MTNKNIWALLHKGMKPWMADQDWGYGKIGDIDAGVMPHMDRERQVFLPHILFRVMVE